MRRTTRVAVVAGLAAIALVGVATLAVLVDPNSHRSAKYLAWRYLGTGDWRYGVRFLNVDPGLRDSLIGRPHGDVAKWFPDLRPGTSRAGFCPAVPEYADTNRDIRQGEWIGDTPWLVVYDGRGGVSKVVLVKGC